MTPRPVSSASSRLDQALQLAQEGRWAAARRRALSALGGETEVHDEQRAAVAKVLGEIAARATGAEQWDEAERALIAALRLAPGFADLHFRLAGVLEHDERLEDALDELHAALRINPNYLAARVELALLQARLGRVGDALEELRRLEQSRKPSEGESFRRGMRSMQAADWEEAGSLLRRAYGLGVKSLEAELTHLANLTREGDLHRARLLLRDLVVTHPTYPDLHCMLGRVELEQGYVDDAVASLLQALELNPGYHAARVLLAQALEADGLLALAEEQIQAVLSQDPAHPEALRLDEYWRSRRGSRSRPDAA
jgi:tetratricopeptide (TPR) repeat protein